MADGNNLLQSYKAKQLLNTYGSSTQPIYFNSGIPNNINNADYVNILDSANHKWVRLAGDTITGNLIFNGTSRFNSAITMNAPLSWTGNGALPQRSSVDYFVNIDAFADGGKTYWTSREDVITSLDSNHKWVRLAGDTMTGLLTTTKDASHTGIKIGDTYITAINGELIFQNNTSLRFGTDSWDYNQWAGLKYVHSSKSLYLGLADGPNFTTNNAQTGGNLYIVNAHLLPSVNNSYTIGNSSYYWNLIKSQWLHVNSSGSGSDGGITLYSNGDANYGILFRQTSNQGTHGDVTADWATYFTMNNQEHRGWVFRRYGSKNVASISTSGTITGQSIASSWLMGQNTTTQPAFMCTDATDTGSYWPWIRQRNTSSGRDFSFGILNTSFYLIGSTTSRTANSYDHGLQFNVADGSLYGEKFQGNWLRIINNSSNNSDDAMVYFENQNSSDWSQKIKVGTYSYGLYIEGTGSYLLKVGTNNNFYVNSDYVGTNLPLKITSNGNTLTIGSLNTGWTHFETTQNIPFYFGRTITTNGDNNPYTDNTRNLGTSSLRWANAYITTVHGSLDGNATTANYLSTYYVNGDNDLKCLQNFFSSCPKSVGTAVRLQHGSHSMAFGWFLSGYDYASAYGGWFISAYGTPYWVGVDSGTWRGPNRIWKQGDSVTSAVWNDYAEYREVKFSDPGRCVFEVGDDTMELTTKRLQKGCSITSDTWGFAQGETETAKTPIAVSGRVLAYPYESREDFRKHIGDAVCSGPNGTVSIMTDEEVAKYPLAIIGIISSVPDYQTWGGGENADRDPVQVNGRVWIRIK